MGVLEEIAAIDCDFSGTIAVSVRHFLTGETIGFNERKQFPTASTIKVPILMEAFSQLEAGSTPGLNALNLLKARSSVGPVSWLISTPGSSRHSWIWHA